MRGAKKMHEKPLLHASHCCEDLSKQAFYTSQRSSVLAIEPILTVRICFNHLRSSFATASTAGGAEILHCVHHV